MDLKNGEIQGDGHKSLLASGEQRDGLELLAGRLHLDLNAAVEDILLVFQLQLRLAAAEQLQEGLLEALVEQLELLGEDHRHLPGDLLNDTQQLVLGLFHVAALLGEVGIAGIDPLELVDGTDIGGAQRLDGPVQLGDAAGGLGDALQLDPLLHSVGMAELIVLPELVQDSLLLQGVAADLLLQPSYLPLAGE